MRDHPEAALGDPSGRSRRCRVPGPASFDLVSPCQALPDGSRSAGQTLDDRPTSGAGRYAGWSFRVSVGPMAELVKISVSPIKGTALEHPSSVALTDAGIPENRRFHLI